MEVAVIAVRMVEGLPDGKVRVVAVRHGFMPAPGRVAVAALHRRAGSGATPAHLEAMLVSVTLVWRMEVAVVQIVGVVAVTDHPVAAARAVPVLVAVVLAAGHGATLESSRRRERESILLAVGAKAFF